MQTLHPDIERLSAFLEGELSPAEAQGLQAHLDACPACREDLAQFQAMLADLKSLPTLTAPPNFVGKVMARVEREPVPVLSLGAVWWKKLMGWKFLAPVAVAMLALFMIRQPEQKNLELPSLKQAEKIAANDLQAPPGADSELGELAGRAEPAPPQAAAPSAPAMQDSAAMPRGDVAAPDTGEGNETRAASANGFAPAPEASVGFLPEAPADRPGERADTKAPRPAQDPPKFAVKDNLLNLDSSTGIAGSVGNRGVGLGGGGAGVGYGAGMGTMGTSGRGGSGPANAGADRDDAAAPKGASERQRLEASTLAAGAADDRLSEAAVAGAKKEESRDESGKQQVRARENRPEPSAADESDLSPAAVGRMTGDKVTAKVAEKKSASTPPQAAPTLAEPVRAEPAKEQQTKPDSVVVPRSRAAARPVPVETPEAGYAPAPPTTTSATRSPKDNGAQVAPAKPRSLAQDMEAQGEAAKAAASGEAPTEGVYQYDGSAETTEALLSRRKAKSSPVVLTELGRVPDAVIVVANGRNVVRELRRLVVEQRGVAGTAEALPNGRQRIVIQLPPNAYGPLVKAIQKSMTLGATPPPASPELQRIWIEILP